MRMLDLFCGRFGWGKAFAERGWEVIGIDIAEPSRVPMGCEFVKHDILKLEYQSDGFICTNDGRNKPLLHRFDFICASSPCEQFSLHGMKHFHPNAPYPEIGIMLFNHTRKLCENSNLPYVMENVRAAQQFVGQAENKCGPFYLWGPGVPPLMPQGITKGMTQRINRKTGKRDCSAYGRLGWSNSPTRRMYRDIAATIPPELANCVADYATRLLENRRCA
jgi:hypothetical protein